MKTESSNAKETEADPKQQELTHFIIALEPGDIELTADALQKAGLTFRPKEQIVYALSTQGRPEVVTSSDLPELLDDINEILQYTGTAPLLKKNVEEWDLAQMRDAVTLIGETIYFQDGCPERLKARVDDWRTEVNEYAPHLADE